MKKLLSRAASAAASLDSRDRTLLIGLALSGGAIAAIQPALGVLFVGLTLLWMGLRA